MEKKKFSIDILILPALIIMFILTKKKIYLALLGLPLGCYLLVYFALRHPHSYWVQLFFRARGARTDIRNMTKNELFQSGVQFLKWVVFLFVIVLLIGYQVDKMVEPTIIFLTLLFAASLLFMTFLGGGLYLLFRGLIRKKNYIPPEPENNDT